MSTFLASYSYILHTEMSTNVNTLFPTAVLQKCSSVSLVVVYAEPSNTHQYLVARNKLQGLIAKCDWVLNLFCCSDISLGSPSCHKFKPKLLPSEALQYT